jgi:CheY-like chemotaxis protein
LTKPVRQSELFGALLDLLGRASETRSRRERGGGKDEGGPLGELLGRRLRILVAEDHPVNQVVATRMLEGLGHEADVVGDGQAALDALASGGYHIVFMDVQMPVMDGFEALAVLRTRERQNSGHQIVIALTAHAMKGDRERCLAAGFDGYLSKPIRADALREVLLDQDLARPAPPAASHDGPDCGQGTFDRKTALENLGDDEKLLEELLGLFLDDCPRLVGEIRAAIVTANAPALKRLGHTAAGAASNFAAPALQAAARRLEAMGKSENLAGAEDACATLEQAVDRFRAAISGATLA